MFYISTCNLEKKTKERKDLNKEQKEYILEVAEKTFRFFKDNITPCNNYLIPDNYQEDRKNKYVDRTSSTNIGLSLLTIMTGVDLRFINLKEGIDILYNIIKTVDELEKWNGHLYNWYNIKTKTPLTPRYISTVDSGNFVGYLYVLKAFIEEKIIEINTGELKDIEHIDKNECKQKLDMIKNSVENLIQNTNFSYLYSKSHRLFSIGFNAEEGKITDSYYDLLASEARQASLVAIAKKDVPSKHWNSLSRTLTVLNNKKGLISWSGTAFEYLMPNINIPRYEGSLLDESSKFAIMSQIQYANRLGIPWGISESAFNVKDFQANYQYKAFGIPWLGLKRGLADDMVVATYGSVLALTDKPQEVYKNLRNLEKYGMYGEYGFYESLDLTPSRQKKGDTASVVATYMAHHQALLLLSINNYLSNNIFVKRFMQNPEIEAVSILLQERMPETFIVTKEEKEIPTKLKYQDYENYVEVQYNKIDENLLRSNVISNENYVVAINQKGQGFSQYKNILINRFKKTDEYNQGIFMYAKNIRSKKIWGIQSCYAENNNQIATFMPDQTKFERIDENIKTNLQITVDSSEPVEIRRITFENLGEQEETLEVSNVFEPVLSCKEQDFAHQAFNNLFLKFDYNHDENVLEVKRKKRGNNEKEINMLLKFFTDCDTIVDNEFEISRTRLDTRGNFEIPMAIVNSTPFSNKIGLVTEPIIALKKIVKIKPKEKVHLDFLISVNEDKEQAYKNLRKYNNSESVRREFEIAKAKVDAENRYLGIKGKELILYQKVLSYILFQNPLKAKQLEKCQIKNYKQSELWKYGISGDRPLIIARIKDINDIYMVTDILKMYEFFRTKNIKVDVVFLDEEIYSYDNYVRGEIEAKIADRHLEYVKNVDGGIFVLTKNEVNKEDIDTLKFVATLIIDTRKGDLEHFIEDMEEEYLNSIQRIDDYVFESNIQEKQTETDFLKNKENLKYYNEYGAFSPDGKEYLITINKNNRLPTVWSHILANEKFGSVITENMGGYSWYKNSRLNRLTCWYNKAFLDIPSEVIYMQDMTSGKTWSLGANPMPDENNYNVVYGFGYAKYIHLSNDILQEMEVFVPNEDSVKISILKLSNKSLSRKKIRIIYYLKPVLGEDEIKTTNYIETEFNKNANLVELKNLYEDNFQNVMYVSSSEKIRSYTGNKKFFLGNGGLSNPDALRKYRLNNENALGREACVAIEIEIELESMSEKEVAFSFGTEENSIELKNTSYKYSKILTCKNELEAVKKKWKDLLERVQVYTPIESINIMLNGWVLYQTMTSRLLGRTGFYQSGGAFGFRDQLQDSMSLKFIEPDIFRKQILKHSMHQFVEGDVEHWWHDETQRGIRTRFSDDLLWLPFMVTQYIEVTDDYSILDEKTSYLIGNQLGKDEDEKYDLYKSSNIDGTIYEHCIKAILKAMNYGEHGIPKIGSGDWNDGFNNVGNKGKGESIWLGFFMYFIFVRFIKICQYVGDTENVKLFEKDAELLKRNLNNYGWDGRWFKRAYMDDGKILGSIENAECRIDSIAQSWSVISGAGDNDKKFISMASLENHLIDKENGIIKLLDPPFENGDIEPGYIKAYLPGVRENGGQYTHAAVWTIIAEAILGFGDKAVELYKMINPIEHSRTKDESLKYKVEPYVIPADVYGAENLVGRGGWTWYTGSSSWYYTAGIQYILGLNIIHNSIVFNPCIPTSWREYSMRYKYGNSIYNIKILNSNGKNYGVSKILLDGNEVENSIKLDGSGKIFNIEVFL